MGGGIYLPSDSGQIYGTATNNLIADNTLAPGAVGLEVERDQLGDARALARHAIARAQTRPVAWLASIRSRAGTLALTG